MIRKVNLIASIFCLRVLDGKVPDCYNDLIHRKATKHQTEALYEA